MKASKFLVLVMALLAIAVIPAAFLGGCAEEQSSNPVEPTSALTDITIAPDDVNPDRPGAEPAAAAVYSGNWAPYILSEVRYALSQNRSGTSSKTYYGKYMGDWNYVTGGTDNWAYQKVATDYSGATGPVGMSTYALGGWCKFFVSLVIFRSSYGLGSNYHLYLPSGYTYATTDVGSAGPGWVVQSTMPHTAIIESPHYNASGVRDGWWLIDANWVGSENGFRYYIGKHYMTDASLRANGFKAWRPNLMKQYF